MRKCNVLRTTWAKFTLQTNDSHFGIASGHDKKCAAAGQYGYSVRSVNKAII